MSPRVCKALGYAVAWLVVCVVGSLLGAHIWGSVFTTIFLLFGIMELFEDKGKEWFNGRFADSYWKYRGAELVATLAIYTPICLLFGLGWDSTMSFWALLLSCFSGALIAAFAGSYLEGFTSGGWRE